VEQIQKLDIKGKETGHITVKKELLERGANSQMIKDYIVALRANARQWSAHTKTRAEVNHSGQKPHPQKGTGKARQGYLGAAQYKGGGRAHGPRAKFDQHVSINRKEKRAAIRHLLAEKILNKQLLILESPSLKAPKTKTVAEFLKEIKLFGKKVLFVAEKETTKKNDNFVRSMRNVPEADLMMIDNVNGYEIVAHRQLIVLDSAVDHLMKILES
jgi:large subunit ribosomal protein L4